MNIWESLERLLEAGEEVIDYPAGQAHPHLQKQRDTVRQAVDWIAQALDRSGTPEMKRIAAELRKAPDAPSDQVPAILSRAHEALWKAKRLQSRVNPTGAKAVEDALQAMPAALSAAAQLGKGNATDKGLWQTRMKGYHDDQKGFVRTGTVTSPRGYEPPPPAEKDVPPKPKPGFTVRRKKESAAPRMSEVWKDRIHGGKADAKEPGDFDQKELRKGVKHEMEHTDDPKLAAEIAMDHIAEDPHYYEKLAKVEHTSLAETFAVDEARPPPGKYDTFTSEMEQMFRKLPALTSVIGPDALSDFTSEVDHQFDELSKELGDDPANSAEARRQFMQSQDRMGDLLSSLDVLFKIPKGKG